QATWLLYGIKPVIIAIIVEAIWGLAPVALKNLGLVVAGVAVVAMYFVGVNTVALLFGVGILVMLLENLPRRRDRGAVPAPAFIPPTSIGYLVAGFPRALLATLAIFLPSFIFVALIYPVVPRLRRSPWTSAFLDGVNAAALGLMAAVAWQLGRAAIIDIPTFAL